MTLEKKPMTSWFHCGRCGCLFKSPLGDSVTRVCTRCGLDPCIGFEPEMNERAAPVRSQDKMAALGKPSRQRRSQGRIPYKLIGAGLIFLFSLLFGAGFLLLRERASVQAPALDPLAAGPSIEDTALLTEAGSQVNQSLAGFLSAGTPEARNQFVLSPIDTAARMARFYDLNLFVSILPETLVEEKSIVLHFSSGRAIETLWKTEDKRQIETVFMLQDEEWRLDWDHYVRFSTFPWSLFLAGSGEDEGEFRLLARQRLGEERADAPDISIVLYAPRFGYGNETGFQSPEFLIKRESEDGRHLAAAFQLAEDGKRPFGVDLPIENPENLIRVRVKVRRVKDEMGSRFELVRVLACHWYSSDEPGFEIPEPKVEP